MLGIGKFQESMSQNSCRMWYQMKYSFTLMKKGSKMWLKRGRSLRKVSFLSEELLHLQSMFFSYSLDGLQYSTSTSIQQASKTILWSMTSLST
jgi:hypothetical protein